MIMAVGSGGDLRDLIACGVPVKERGARLEEGIVILRKLWSESHVTHHGRFYSFEDVTIEPKPHDGPLDIWIGGKSDAILKRTARLGDGWFPALTSPEEFKRDMERLIAFGQEYGRTMNPREAGVLLFTYLTDDRERARQVMAPFVRALPMAPEEVEARFVVGTAAQCVEKIRRFVEAGCAKFVLRPSCPPAEVPAQIERYGREILPRFC